MLREQLLTAWNALKEQIITCFKELKLQAQNASNSQLKELEAQIAIKNQAIESKWETIYSLNGPDYLDEKGDSVQFEENSNSAQKIALEAELDQLKKEKRDLEKQITNISPLRKDLYKLNHLYSLEQSLQARDKENQDYLSRIERAEEKWTNSEKKLDTIRDLLETNQLNKLTALFKQGQI